MLGALLGPAMTLFQKLTAAGELEKQLKQVRTARATSFLVKNGKNARSIDRKTDDAALYNVEPIYHISYYEDP